MTHNVLNSYHARNAAYRSFLRNRNEQSFMKYKQLRNEATRQTRLAKRLFFMHGARLGTRYFWKNIKDCTGYGKLKAFINPWPDANKTAATNSANKINSFFIESVLSVASKFTNSIPSSSQPSVNYKEQWSIKPISERDILNAIASLPNNSSTGNDNISAKMLKHSGPYISHVLSNIFNSSIDSGIFPSSWKCANVVPIHKRAITSTSLIIDQSHCCLYSAKYSKKLLTLNCVTSFQNLLYYMTPNMASEKRGLVNQLFYAYQNAYLARELQVFGHA